MLGRIGLCVMGVLAAAVPAHAQFSYRGTGEKQAFTVNYRPSIWANYSGQVTAWPTISLSNGKVYVQMNSEVKVLAQRNPGGLAEVSWQIDLSNVGEAFKEVRVNFNTGTVSLRVGGSAEIPPYAGGFTSVEVEYDWVGGNRRTLTFNEFKLESTSPAAVPERVGGVFLLHKDLLPKPKETAEEAARKRDEEAKAARKAAAEKKAEMETMHKAWKDVFARLQEKKAEIENLRGQLAAETDAAKRSELEGRIRRETAAFTKLRTENEKPASQWKKLRDEEAALTRAAERAEAAAAELRKIAAR
jgi:hypothetical protein